MKSFTIFTSSAKVDHIILHYFQQQRFGKWLAVREFYQPYPTQFCDVEQHYQIRARATK